MPTPTAQEVKRVPLSEDLLHPGDFVFIPGREPNITYRSIPLNPPKGWGRRQLWYLFGKKFEIQQIVSPVWPAIDTVIIKCPICNGDVATTERHTIANTDPLTIETPITCPYCRTFTFKVVEGKIMLA